MLSGEATSTAYAEPDGVRDQETGYQSSRQERLVGAMVEGRTVGRLAAAVGGSLGAAQLVPAATWLPPVRSRVAGLDGAGHPGHVALTFDDGPDAGTTPAVLDVLDRYDVRATFFVLGSKVAADPSMLRRLVADGHEVAVHGWVHRRMLWQSPGAVVADLVRTSELIARVSDGTVPRWFRPPYGVLSGSAAVGARRTGLRPVLWGVWGREWRPGADVGEVRELLCRRVAGGRTVLLHDADDGRGYAALVPQALPAVIQRCRSAGWAVGPLRDHGLAGTSAGSASAGRNGRAHRARTT